MAATASTDEMSYAEALAECQDAEEEEEAEQPARRLYGGRD